jgi:hypothetical protein
MSSLLDSTGEIQKNFLGNVSQYSGIATITNPATSVTVSYGGSGLSASSRILVSFVDDASSIAPASAVTLWTANVSATQFSINVSATPSASNSYKVVWWVLKE